jgi:hypothetical protein
MSEKHKAIVHGELHDDGSYHCLLAYPGAMPNEPRCEAIEWSRSDFVEHLRSAHQLNVSSRRESGDVVIDGEPALIDHRGAMHDRVEGEKCNYHGCLREKAFADAWEKAQRDDEILAALSSKTAPKGTPGAWRPLSGVFHDEYRVRSWSSDDEDTLYSQRDATVAATVVQWLGTNVGFCWLEETLKKAGYIVELKAVREGVERHVRSLQTSAGQLHSGAEQFAVERDQWKQRADTLHASQVELLRYKQKSREIIEGCLTDLAIAALRYAQAHAQSEAQLFERFVQRRAQILQSAYEHKRGFSTLEDIAHAIGVVIGAVHQLRDLAEGTNALTHAPREGEPQTISEPREGKIEAPASGQTF